MDAAAAAGGKAIGVSRKVYSCDRGVHRVLQRRSGYSSRAQFVARARSKVTQSEFLSTNVILLTKLQSIAGGTLFMPRRRFIVRAILIPQQCVCVPVVYYSTALAWMREIVRKYSISGTKYTW